MSRPVHKVWSRLSKMSWDELHTRLRQEAGKRMDTTLFRLGVHPGLNQRRNVGGWSGRFFFSPAELPKRVSLLRQYLPLEMEGVVREADEICCHRFRLLGHSDLDYGKDIDWHLDALHGKRTGLIPWYKIDFLDFELAGDHKVTWELNRHQHLVTLAKAWLLTGDEKYVKETVAQWYAWQRANPYPLGINWASSLEIAFRSLSWLWLRHLLADCSHLPASFENDLQRGLALGGRHIERYLSTYFSPNTHLLGEALALFFLGTLCPQIASAEQWKKDGWRIIQEEALRQVRPDGVYFEQSLYYHVYALDFFLHARLLALRNGMEIPPDLDDVIRKMLRVVQTLAQVGPLDGFGDDDGGRLFNPRRNRPEHLTDPLAIGASLFRGEGLSTATGVTEEAIWLLGGDAVADTHTAARQSCPPKTTCFADGGLYILADLDPIPQQMVIDAGPHGTGRSGHGHADALSVKMSLDNRVWLVDAGTFAYVTPGSERRSFRGTLAHNTMTVDGLDQAEPEGPFAWSALPITQTEHWIRAAKSTLFVGSHSGYERLAQPVRHRRFVFHLGGSFWMVRDVAEGTGTHLLQTSWHFAPDLEVSAEKNKFVASPSIAHRSNSPFASHLTMLAVPDRQWNYDLVKEQISPTYGAVVLAPVVRCSAQVALPSEHAVLLFPSTDTGEVSREFLRITERTTATKIPSAVYTYDLRETWHCMIFGHQDSEPWTFGPWSSDAMFFYVCMRGQRVIHLLCCQGTSVYLHGEPVFSRVTPLQYLEWTNGETGPQSFASDDAALFSLSEAALEASIPT